MMDGMTSSTKSAVVFFSSCSTIDCHLSLVTPLPCHVTLTSSINAPSTSTPVSCNFATLGHVVFLCRDECNPESPMYDIGFREAVLRAYLHCKSFRRLGFIFGVAPSTICRWKQRKHPITQRRPSSITEHVKRFIRGYLCDHPFTSAKKMSMILKDVFRHSFSRQLACVAIHCAGMSKVKLE